MNGRVGDYFTRFKDSFARERPYNDTQIDEKQHILLLTAPKERGLPGRATRGCTRDTEAASWCCKRAYVQQAGWVKQLSQAPCGLANLNDFASSGAWGCL